jgi:predicted DsbA family dithiol-disulfide isomerase
LSRLSFTYWSDPLCVWAFVAQGKLDELLETFGDRVDVRHRVVPVFGSVPHRFREGSWAAKGVEGRVAATRKVASMFGHDGVTGSVWRDDPPASSWAPALAIKAAFGLAEDGGIDKGQACAFQRRLRRRFFIDDVNIARRPEQLLVAEQQGLPVAELERRLDDGTAMAALFEDHQAREAQMITGSPTYVFDGGRAKLYGNFDANVLHATVQQLLCGMDAGGSDCR